jgi:hypothetical protein
LIKREHTGLVEFGERNTNVGVARTHGIGLGKIFGTMNLDLQNPNSSGSDTGFSTQQETVDIQAI